MLLCLGEQSFKHANVLSEKNNFSAPGGPKSTIFDTDDVDPLYFEVTREHRVQQQVRKVENV